MTNYVLWASTNSLSVLVSPPEKGRSEWFWGPDLGSLVTVLAVVIGGGLAVITYWRAAKKEKAEWLHGLFRAFYVDAEFRELRMVLEYDKDVRPAIKKVLPEPQPLEHRETKLLTNLDSILNYFKFILYLEAQGQLTEEHRSQMFKYWFKLLLAPDREDLRRYIKRYEYGALYDFLPKHLFFYGSLMRETVRNRLEIIPSQLTFIGDHTIEGKLHDLGDFPGLTAGKSRVRGQLFKIHDPEVFQNINKYEEFFPDNIPDSLFVKTAVEVEYPFWASCSFDAVASLRRDLWPPLCFWETLKNPWRPLKWRCAAFLHIFGLKKIAIRCWVYLYNRDVTPKSVIPHGDWEKHLAERSSIPGKDANV